MAKYTFVVLSNPTTPAQEAEYNEWYNKIHIADVLNVPGFVAAQRFKLAEAQFADGTHGSSLPGAVRNRNRRPEGHPQGTRKARRNGRHGHERWNRHEGHIGRRCSSRWPSACWPRTCSGRAARRSAAPRRDADGGRSRRLARGAASAAKAADAALQPGRAPSARGIVGHAAAAGPTARPLPRVIVLVRKRARAALRAARARFRTAAFPALL